MLSDPQIDRYSRQILIAEIGGRGQERLLASRVAIVGDDPVVQFVGAYLAAAGIGRLCVPTAFVAELSSMNPDCRVEPIAADDVQFSPRMEFSVVISTQTQAAERNSLVAACAAAPTTLLWGTSSGCWAVLHPNTEPLPCVECLLANSEAADPADSLWVASQLAMAAMRTILGLGLPSNPLPHCFSALGGDRDDAAMRAGCVHRAASPGALVESAREEVP